MKGKMLVAEKVKMLRWTEKKRIREIKRKAERKLKYRLYAMGDIGSELWNKHKEACERRAYPNLK